MKDPNDENPQFITPDEYIEERLKSTLTSFERKVTNIQRYENQSFFQKYWAPLTVGVLTLFLFYITQDSTALIFGGASVAYLVFHLIKNHQDNQAKKAKLEVWIKELNDHLKEYQAGMSVPEADQEHHFAVLVTKTENTLGKHTQSLL